MAKIFDQSPEILRRKLLTTTGAAIVGFGAGTLAKLGAAKGAELAPFNAERTVQEKLSDTISIREFGAVGKGDETSEFQAALTYVADNNLALELENKEYFVSAQILMKTTATSLAIICNRGMAKINVRGGILERLFHISEAENILLKNVEIVGNGRVASVFDIRRTGTGGTISIENVKITDAKQDTQTAAAYGIFIRGEYDFVEIKKTKIVGITRTGAGECKGIAVVNFTGIVEINSCLVKDVLAPLGHLIDADGIAVYGKSGLLDTEADMGSALIVNCTVRNVTGRWIKSQLEGTTVRDCKFFQDDGMELITNFIGIDFQRGNGAALFNKFTVGTVTNFTSAAYVEFQNTRNHQNQDSIALGNVVSSDVTFGYFCLLLTANGNNTVTLTNNKYDLVGQFLQSSETAGDFTSHHIIANDNIGAVVNSFYKPANKQDFATALTFCAAGNRETSAGGMRKIIEYESGLSLGTSFVLGDNPWFENEVQWTFVFDNLLPGNSFITTGQTNAGGPVAGIYVVETTSAKQTVTTSTAVYNRINNGVWL